MALEGCYLSFVGKYPGYTQKTLTSRAKTIKAKVLKDFTEDLINEVGADNVYLLVSGGSSIAGQQKYLLAKELGTHILDTEWLLDCQKQKTRLDTADYLYQEAQTAAPDTETHESDEEGGEVETSTAENNDQVLDNNGDDGGNVDGDLEEEVDDWENSRRVTKQDKKRQRKTEDIRQQEERKREQVREKGEAKDYEKNNKKNRGQEEGEKERGKKQRDADEETGKNKADRGQTRDRSMTLVASDTEQPGQSDTEYAQPKGRSKAGKTKQSDNQGSNSTKKDPNRHVGLSKVKPVYVSDDEQSDDDGQASRHNHYNKDDGQVRIKFEDAQSDEEIQNYDMESEEDANLSQDDSDVRSRKTSKSSRKNTKSSRRSGQALSSRDERKRYHLGPSRLPELEDEDVEQIELIRDPDDELSQRSTRVQGEIMFMWNSTYLGVSLPGKNKNYPGEERVYLISAGQYSQNAQRFRQARNKSVLQTFDKFSLQGLSVEDMYINVVASTPDDSKSVILARKSGSQDFLLYSRTTFNQAFGGKAGDHTINARRKKTGQKALTQTQRAKDTPEKYLRIQGI